MSNTTSCVGQYLVQQLRTRRCLAGQDLSATSHHRRHFRTSVSERRRCRFLTISTRYSKADSTWNLLQLNTTNLYNNNNNSKTMFMVLSSWQSHCGSSPGSFDKWRTLPSGRQPYNNSKTMFMVLSSWQSHCGSSPGSYEEQCQTAADPRPSRTT